MTTNLRQNPAISTTVDATRSVTVDAAGAFTENVAAIDKAAKEEAPESMQPASPECTTRNLAASLQRFSKAVEKLERQRLGLGETAPYGSTAVQSEPAANDRPATEKDIRDYLECVDECFGQLEQTSGAGEVSMAEVLKLAERKMIESHPADPTKRRPKYAASRDSRTAQSSAWPTDAT